MMPGVQGRVALVTGAGNPDGIGFAIARALVSAGASVAISATSDRIFDRARELGKISSATAAWKADLSDPGQANELVANVTGKFGRLDILVNNAGMVQTGIPKSWSRVEEISDTEWRSAMSLSLDTCFFASRAAIPAMKDQRHGRIINISSVSGPLVVFEFGGAYASAKAAMTGLTRSQALELGPHGITANAIAPGWIANGKPSQNLLTGGANTPVGRPGTPDEVASLALYLAMDEASYLTGQVIVVDGGNIIQESKRG